MATGKRLQIPIRGLALVAGLALARAGFGDSLVEVSLRLEEPQRALPADFLGVSFEMDRVLPDAKGIYYFRPDNVPLVQMFKTLGIKSLRVGGNTVDRATVKFPEEKDLDSFFGFAKAAGVKVIFTMRLKGVDPEASAKTAAYIWGHYNESMMAFAVGNEPNVFTSDYHVFLAAWKKHEQAILAVAPEARFAGPAATSGKAAAAGATTAPELAGGPVNAATTPATAASTEPAMVSVTLAELGLTGPVAVRDLWTHTNLDAATESVSANINSHGAVLYRLSPK